MMCASLLQRIPYAIKLSGLENEAHPRWMNNRYTHTEATHTIQLVTFPINLSQILIFFHFFCVVLLSNKIYVEVIAKRFLISERVTVAEAQSKNHAANQSTRRLPERMGIVQMRKRSAALETIS